MNIANHHLVNETGSPVPFRATPNIGAEFQPRYLVIHYTGGSSMQSSVEWLCNPSAKASAHVVVGRDGGVVQLAPFNRVTWHAGKSAWEGLTGLNSHSIGIELDNAGRVMARGDGKWVNGLGVVVPNDQVVEGRHKNDGQLAHWHLFSPEQIEAARSIGATLVEHYGLVDVIGHDDVSPGRKHDPGPAFPMETFRSLVMGRADETPDRYRTTTMLNIRSGAGVGFSPMPGSPLPMGTPVERLRSQADWFFVAVLDGSDLEGWVHSRFLQRT